MRERRIVISIKRAYEPAKRSDGMRFLVDHLWPRGVKKEDLQIEAWLKEIAPSTELRKWFGHDPEKWKEFRKRYFAELKEKSEALKPLLDAARDGDITLVFGARDTEHNNAVALKTFLEKKLAAKSRKHANAGGQSRTSND